MVDQGTVDKLNSAVTALQALQENLGSAGVSDEHIQAVGAIVTNVASVTSDIASIVPGRTAADVAQVADVTAAAVPTLEVLAQDFETLYTKFKAFMGL